LPRPHKRPSTVRSPATATASVRSRMSTLLKPNSCKLATRRPMLTARPYQQRPRWRWRPALLAAPQDRIRPALRNGHSIKHPLCEQAVPAIPRQSRIIRGPLCTDERTSRDVTTRSEKSQTTNMSRALARSQVIVHMLVCTPKPCIVSSAPSMGLGIDRGQPPYDHYRDKKQSPDCRR
jgi:hypothetical protein